MRGVGYGWGELGAFICLGKQVWSNVFSVAVNLDA